MYKLYTRRGSGSFVVEAALELAGVAFEGVEVPKSRRDEPEFREISPMGQVPVMVLPDGRVMTKSAAMCILIAERHPEAALAPPDEAPERADFLRWMVFLSTVVYPAILRLYYASRYTTDPDGVEGVRAAALAEIDFAFGVLDRGIGGRDWLLENFSVADIYLLMLFQWHPDMERAARDFAGIERVAARLRAMPALARLNASHAMW